MAREDDEEEIEDDDIGKLDVGVEESNEIRDVEGKCD